MGGRVMSGGSVGTASEGRNARRGIVSAARGRAVPLLAALVLAVAASAPLAAGAAGEAEPAAAMPLAPVFVLPGIEGEVALDEHRGEVVYVDFWASWCPPCLRSFPWMNALAERYREAGLRVVAINVDAERGEAERFLERVPAGFDVAFDPEGRTAEAFGLVGMPSSYLVDRDGRLVLAHVGFRERDTEALERAIERVLEEDGR